MQLKLTRSRLAIGLAGVATIALVILDPAGPVPSPVVAAVEKPRLEAGRGPRAVSSQIVAALPARAALGPQHGDPFSARSWAPPPPPPPKQAEIQAAPAPPPNPYRFAGTSLHNGKLRTFVTDGIRVYEVSDGDELNGGYRVEAVTPDEVVLVYTPLGSRHPIAAKRAFSAPDHNRLAAAR